MEKTLKPGQFIASAAQKRAATKEIKEHQEYYNTLIEIKASQGTQFSYKFEDRQCDRWMYLGDYFFPSTINKAKRDLDKAIENRSLMV